MILFADVLHQRRKRIHAPVLQAASSDVRAGKLGMDALPPLVQHICKQYHLYEKS